MLVLYTIPVPVRGFGPTISELVSGIGVEFIPGGRGEEGAELYPAEANLAELSEGVRSAPLELDDDRVRALGTDGTGTAARSPVGRAKTPCRGSCKGRGEEPAPSTAVPARVCEVPEADDVDENVRARGKAYLAPDPSEGARTVFEGEVEVDLTLAVEIVDDLGFAIELVDLALLVDLEFEFEFDVEFIRELGRRSPPLGRGGNDFSLLNFIPSPDPDPFTGVVELDSTSPSLGVPGIGILNVEAVDVGVPMSSTEGLFVGVTRRYLEPIPVGGSNVEDPDESLAPAPYVDDPKLLLPPAPPPGRAIRDVLEEDDSLLPTHSSSPPSGIVTSKENADPALLVLVLAPAPELPPLVRFPAGR